MTEQREATVLLPSALHSGRIVTRFRSSTLLVILAFIILLWPFQVIVLSDRRPLPWDAAYYAQFSVSLSRTLMLHPERWPVQMLQALGDRAPGICWIGQLFVPLKAIFPLPQTALLFSILATQAITLALLFQSLRKVFSSRKAAFVSSVFALAGPLFVGLTFNFLVEPLQGITVTWLLLLVAFARDLNRRILTVHIVAVIAFGLLAKTSSPLYQFPLLVYVCYQWARREQRTYTIRTFWNEKLFFYTSLGATSILVLGTVGWYLMNFPATLQHLKDASSSDYTLFWGHKGTIVAKFKWWLGSFQISFLWRPLTAVVGLSALVAIILRIRRGSRLNEGDVLALLSICWIGAVLLLFSRQINEDTRYLFPLFPYVAILICWLAATANGLAWLLGSAAFIQYLVVLGIATGALARQPDLSNYLVPYERDGQYLDDNLFCVEQTADSTPEHQTVVGEELSEFDAVGLNFYGLLQGYTSTTAWRYTGVDFTESNPNVTWDRISNGNARYYVFRTHDTPSLDQDVFNRTANFIHEKVRTSKKFSYRPGKSNGRVLVYERVDTSGAATMKDMPGTQTTTPSADLPFGALDIPRAGAVLPLLTELTVAGWAAAPSPLESPEVFLDGRFAAKAPAASRPDVTNAYRNLKTLGFSASIDLSQVPDGVHRLSIRSRTRTGLVRIIADVPILTSFGFNHVPPSGALPFGHLDVPQAGLEVDPDRRTVSVMGWAASQTGISRIEILLDNQHAVDAPKMRRPDVETAFLNVKTTGYQAEVPLETLKGGRHILSVLTFTPDGKSRTIAAFSLTRSEDK